MAYRKRKSSFDYVFFRLVILVLSVFIYGCQTQRVMPFSGNTPAYNENVIVALFDDAELQIEADDQREELAKALNDMLILSPSELRKKLYANYQLEPNKWPIHEILLSYYAGRSPREFSELLFDDMLLDESKEAIKKALIEVNKRY